VCYLTVSHGCGSPTGGTGGGGGTGVGPLPPATTVTQLSQYGIPPPTFGDTHSAHGPMPCG